MGMIFMCSFLIVHNSEREGLPHAIATLYRSERVSEGGECECVSEGLSE